MGFFDSITNVFNQAGSWISNAAKTVANSVGGFVTSVVDKGAPVVTQIYNDAKTGIGTV